MNVGRSVTLSLLVAACVLVERALANLQPPVTFSMAGVDETEGCATTLLVLYANIDPACSGSCRLVISQTSGSAQQAEDAAIEHGTVLSSRIQESNTVTLPELKASPSIYSFSIVCDDSRRCESTPSAWKIVHTPSSLQLQRSTPAQHASGTVDAESLLPIGGCVYEINVTIIHSLSSKNLKASAPSNVEGGSHLQTWLLRTLLLVCCLILQRASACL